MSYRTNKKIWAAASMTGLFAFLTLAGYILLASKLSFFIYVLVIVVVVLVLPTILVFLDLSGYRETIWEFWQSLSLSVHKGILLISLFWVCFLVVKALLPTIRKEYERN